MNTCRSFLRLFFSLGGLLGEYDEILDIFGIQGLQMHHREFIAVFNG